MAEITMTVRQILNLGLWDKVCEYKDWSPWILNEGQIDENEDVTFDDTFEKPEEVDTPEEVTVIEGEVFSSEHEELADICYESGAYFNELLREYEGKKVRVTIEIIG